MFVFDFKNNKMPDMAEFKENLDLEVFLVDSQVSKEARTKDTIYSIFINFAIFEYLGLDSGSILKKFNNSFKLAEENNSMILQLKSKLDEISTLVSSFDFNSNELDSKTFLEDLQSILIQYYKLKSELMRKIINNDVEIEELIRKLESYKPIPLEVADPMELDKEITKPRQKQILDEKVNSEIQIKNDSNHEVLKNPLSDLNKDNSTLDIDSKKETSKIDNKPIFEHDDIISMQEPKTNANIDGKLKDNMTLLVSETEGTVYLPYQVEDLEAILEESPDDYKDLEDLIQSEYILPLSIFKNASLSRFKEGYRLIRNKDKESIVKALSIGLDLMNNTKLHPAIIAACKNEDELYIYLDCLEKNQLDKFKFFDIKFDMTPIAK